MTIDSAVAVEYAARLLHSSRWPEAGSAAVNKLAAQLGDFRYETLLTPPGRVRHAISKLDGASRHLRRDESLGCFERWLAAVSSVDAPLSLFVLSDVQTRSSKFLRGAGVVFDGERVFRSAEGSGVGLTSSAAHLLDIGSEFNTIALIAPQAILGNGRSRYNISQYGAERFADEVLYLVLSVFDGESFVVLARDARGTDAGTAPTTGGNVVSSTSNSGLRIELMRGDIGRPALLIPVSLPKTLDEAAAFVEHIVWQTARDMQWSALRYESTSLSSSDFRAAYRELIAQTAQDQTIVFLQGESCQLSAHLNSPEISYYLLNPVDYEMGIGVSQVRTFGVADAPRLLSSPRLTGRDLRHMVDDFANYVERLDSDAMRGG